MRMAKWLLALVLLISSGVSRADLWFEAQYGGSVASEYPIVGVELNFAEKHRVYSVGLTENLACFLRCFDDVFYSEFYASYGIRKQINSFFTTTGQVGISAFRKADFGCDVVCDQTVLGMPIDVGLMGSGRYAGLGLNLRLSINSIQTTATITLSTAFGRIR